MTLGRSRMPEGISGSLRATTATIGWDGGQADGVGRAAGADGDRWRAPAEPTDGLTDGPLHKQPDGRADAQMDGRIVTQADGPTDRRTGCWSGAGE